MPTQAHSTTLAALLAGAVLAAGSGAFAAEKKDDPKPRKSSSAKAKGAPADSENPVDQFWRDADFVKKFMGFSTTVEPKLTPEEQLFFKSLSDRRLLDEDPAKAAQEIEAKLTPTSTALLDYTLATIAFKQDDMARAAKHFEAATAKYPNFLRAHRNLGFVLAREGKFAEAIPHLTRAIELGGADGNTYGTLGFCYVSEERHLAAVTAYQQAILFAPDNLEWKLGLVKSQIATGNYRPALELLDEMIAKNPTRESLWALQAGVFLQTEQPAKAAVNFEVLRKFGKATAKDLMLLGDIYMTQEAKELALGAYLEGVEKEGGQNLARALRAADILVSRGAWDEARALFKKVRDTAGGALAADDELKLLKLESKVAAATGAGDDAIKTLEQIIARNPLDGEALILAGEYYARADQAEKAAYRYETAAKISGFEAEAWVKHAQLLVASQKYQPALELLRKAQKLKPRDNVQRYLEKVEAVARATRS
jgi:tetratricopeptide (TPR) repeat protein